MALQRPAIDEAGPTRATPLAHELLRSPERPLELTMLARKELRFGHDFSRVRVHSNARAVEPVAGICGLANGVGRDPLFTAGPYRRQDGEGRHGVAHEVVDAAHQLDMGAASDCSLRRYPAVQEARTGQQCGAMIPCETVKGTPTAIPAGDNSIVCKGGSLTVQNNNTGPDKACTQAHESSHIQDWKNRYGNGLCTGVPDGSLPVGGPGYDEFLRVSECGAYKIGKACRDHLLTAAAATDKAAIQAGIDRDKEQLKNNKCA